MSAQIQPTLEVITPGVNDTSPLVGTRPPPSPLSPEDIAHRKGFWEFVETHGAPWHKQHLGRLLDLWMQWNREHYQGALVPPYILLSEPSEPKRLGDCGSVSGFGGRSQIRIRPSLLLGTHPHIRPEKIYTEGRFLFVADVLLHEMIHQWQQEIVGNSEPHYHGHGPIFRDKCNEIGERLGLPRVRTSKMRGRDADLPSCSHWPHEVRPDEFYQGAYRPLYKVCSTQALCAASIAYAEEPTDENLIGLGRVAIAYHKAREAKQAKRALALLEEDDD